MPGQCLNGFSARAVQRMGDAGLAVLGLIVGRSLPQCPVPADDGCEHLAAHPAKFGLGAVRIDQHVADLAGFCGGGWRLAGKPVVILHHVGVEGLGIGHRFQEAVETFAVHRVGVCRVHGAYCSAHLHQSLVLDHSL
jgi:hypothetical protein